nr:uncharacterized protein LOC124815760 isoform X2 [Hydra vulgaris]
MNIWSTTVRKIFMADKKQLQVSKYMQSKIVGDIAHVLKSSITVDSARMKTLVHFCIMEYKSWQFLTHCHPNADY